MIAFHMIIGYLGFILAWTHALMHVVDFKNASDPGRRHLWDTAFPAYHQPNMMEIWMTQEAVTGIGMLVVFTIAFPFASPWPRSSRVLRGTWIGKVLPAHDQHSHKFAQGPPPLPNFCVQFAGPKQLQFLLVYPSPILTLLSVLVSPPLACTP